MDKVDNVVVQAIGLLDELDKDVNAHAMRVKEWCGWHFPEVQEIVTDNALHAKVVMKYGKQHGEIRTFFHLRRREHGLEFKQTNYFQHEY